MKKVGKDTTQQSHHSEKNEAVSYPKIQDHFKAPYNWFQKEFKEGQVLDSDEPLCAINEYCHMNSQMLELQMLLFDRIENIDISC